MRLGLVAILALCGMNPLETARAQEVQKQAPKTQLEAFTGEVGVVIIKGYTEVGSVSGTGKAEVTAMTFRNAKTGEEKSGIVIEVKTAGSYHQEGRSLIDYDEIDGLVEGIRYVSKTERSATKLRNFEATYSTKGDLKVIVFNDASGKKMAAIQVGNIGARQAYVSMENLTAFSLLVQKAKGILDNPAAAGETASGPSPISGSAPTVAPALKPKSSQQVPARP
jgi:hypothetical protein